MNIHEKSRYHEVYARATADPEGFWADAAKDIDWIKPADKVFDGSQGVYGRWFTGAVVNTCLLYTSPSPRDGLLSRMPSSA